MEEIEFHQTMMVRARADLLYRLVLDPHMRAQWDPNIAKASYAKGHEQLKQGSEVKLKFKRSLLWASTQIRYGQLQPPMRGGFEIIRPVGPLEKLKQLWQFKAVPGGTEITMRIKGAVRYKWARRPVERLLMNMITSTLMGLQKKVDGPLAQKMEEKAKELQQKQKEERKAAKKRKKTPPSKT